VTTVREAEPDERAAVRNVVDGAGLALDAAVLEAALHDGDALVAVPDEGPDPQVLGALVLDGERIAAVAVRRRRRGQGIGTALVEAAAARRDRLVAEFDPALRPFWAGLDFDIDAADEDRLRAIR
jgi:GNAT superfamily N-acetyltransferase